MKKIKNKQKIIQNSILILSILCIITIIFIGTFSSFLFNKKFYDSIYQNSGAYNDFDKETVDKKTIELFLFFQNKGSLDNNFYTQNELSHMDDVKSLMKKFMLAYYISIILLLAIYISFYYFYKEDFPIFLLKTLFFSGLSSLIIIGLLFGFSFTSVFDNFHKIFFPMGNYTFSYDSNLIKMFSETFFMMFAKAIFIISGIKAIIISSIGVYGLNKRNYF